MGKKESLNKKEASKQPKEPKEKCARKSSGSFGIPDKIFGVVKFILGLCLLPFVYAVSAVFVRQISIIEPAIQGYFWAGVITFISFHIFIGELVIIYDSGHRLLEVIFSFFMPLVKVAPYLLPVYTIILCLVYAILSLLIKSAWLLQYTLFLLGFTTMLHLVFSAKTVRSQENDFLKGNYIFGFSFIYIVNVGFIALILSFMVSSFNFGDFVGHSLTLYKDIFYAIFKQLFVY
ncbi:MAG: hypothetical protein NTZ92_00945 [Candidatus Omnitrophica bacterium]|nr:hypothetical protein [Candidatus Omnitrophota bacterium]